MFGEKDRSDLSPPVTNLTITNTATTTGTAAIWLSSLGSGMGANNNTIRNAAISCGTNQATGTSTSFGIFSGGTAISITSDGADNDNNSFIENNVTSARYGIFVRGASGNPNDMTSVSDNLIGPSAFGATEIGRGGIVIQHQNTATVADNEIRFVGGDFANRSTFGKAIGIGVGSETGPTSPNLTVITNSTITRNLIHDIVDERTGSAVGIMIGEDATAASTNTVVNNMIYNVRANGTVSDHSAGIAIAGGNGDKVVFNSIYMTGDLDPTGAASATQSSVGIRIVSTTPANLTLKNNAIHLDQTSNTVTLRHYAVVAPSTGYLWGTGGSDYNDYFINAGNAQMAFGGIGTTVPYTVVADLPTWRTQFTLNQDSSSQDLNPLFVSTTDLHLQSTSPLDGDATPIAGITVDFDGDTRNVTNPDIGADEFAPATNPTGVGNASPNPVAQGGAVTLSVTVTPGTNPTSTGVAVTGDLTEIGGSATQQFYDDGTNGDTTGSDNIFTFATTVAIATTPGAKMLPTTITDAQMRMGAATINLTVNASVQPGTIQLSSTTYTIGEGTSMATITATRTGGSDGAVGVSYSTTSGGTATSGAMCGGSVDYVAVMGTLSWTDGDSASKTFDIPICNDTTDEPDETVNLAITTPTGGATLGTPNTAVLTIEDNDPQPAVSITDVSQVEGNAGTSMFTFNVTLSNPSSGTITVDAATADGSATQPSDYTAIASQTVTFDPGDTSKNVTVSVNGDTAFEPDETFFVNLSNASANASILDNQGVGTILNDECTPAPSGMISWYAAEGNASDVQGINNGMALNGAGYTTGKVGQAFNFDGVDDVVTVPNSASLQFTASNPFSIDAWVNLGVGGMVGNESSLVTKWGGGAGQFGYSIRTDVTTGKFAFVIDHFGVASRNVLLSTTTPVANTWYHVAATHDGTTLRIYVNGVLEASMARTVTASTPSTTPLEIGTSTTNGDQGGTTPRRIDEVEIFNRALTLGEIQNIFNASGGGKCMAPEISVQQPAGIEMTDGVSTVDYGGQPLNTPGAKTFTIRNIGSATLSVGAVVIDGANAANFVADTSGTSSTLAPGASTTFIVTFTPAAPGARAAALHLTNGDSDENPFDINLTGYGDTCSAPPVNMVSWYPGEGNSNDIAGLNNGMALNGAGYTTGKVGQAFNFDGVDDVVSVPNSASLQFTASNPFSIDAWVNLGVGGMVGNESSLVTKWGGGAGQFGYSIRTDVTTGKFAFVIDHFGLASRNVLLSTTTPVANTWYHVAATHDGTTLRIYVNGVLEASMARTVTASTPSTTPLEIGTSTTNGDQGGTTPRRIDEVEIFNRALTLGEIQDIFNANTAGKCHTSWLQFSSPTYSVSEAGPMATITVTRNGAHDSTAGVSYASVAGGTATAGTDYTAVMGSLSFGSGEVSKTFDVPITEDNVFEGDETVNLTLSNTTGTANLGSPNAAVLTITDNDTQPTVQFSSATYSIGEGLTRSSLAGDPTVIITVNRSGALGNQLTVDYASVAGGTATGGASCTAGIDYITPSGTLTFVAGDTVETFVIPTCPDSTFEGDETVNLGLSNVTGGGTLGMPSTAVLTITDNDLPVITLDSSSYIQDESQTMVVTVERSGTGSGTSSVLFTTGGGNATGGTCMGAADYESQNTTVTFTGTQTSQTVNIPISADMLNEFPETFNITLSSVMNATLGSPSMAVATINEAATQFQNLDPIAITDGAVTSSVINVSGATSDISYVRVTLFDISDDVADDLNFLLVGPGGQKFVLMADAGGTGAIGPETTITFNDNSAAFVPDASTIASGSYKPSSWEMPDSMFPAPAPAGPYAEPGPGGTPARSAFMNTIFGGLNANGAWTLYIYDDNGGSFKQLAPGTIAGGWGIEMVGPTAAGVSLSGRVTDAEGRGIRNATITIEGGGLTEPRIVATGSMGYYNVEDLTVGTYIVTVQAKRHSFANPTRALSMSDNVGDFDFIAEP